MSSLRQTVRKMVDTGLDRLGYRLLRRDALTPELTLDAALARVTMQPLPIGTVIDVGASNGQWSAEAMRFFPDARYLLIEANRVHQPALDRFRAAHPNVEVALMAGGDREGTLYFDAADDFGGVASHSPTGGKCIEVPVTTIDAQVKQRALPPPYLVKLDTHGFEVPIFEGARETLKQANLVIVEAYNFKLTEECLRFHETCAYLEQRGLRCVDLCGPMHRTKDGAFWQVDLLFIPADRPQFRTNTYA